MIMATQLIKGLVLVEGGGGGCGGEGVGADGVAGGGGGGGGVLKSWLPVDTAEEGVGDGCAYSSNLPRYLSR